MAMKDLRSILIRVAMNKYFVAFFLFLVYLLFFDRYNIPSQFRRMAELREIERYRAFYQAEISANESELRNLNSGTEAMERFARETYYMKRDNEDVFIIEAEE